jgi:hypothetical protein
MLNLLTINNFLMINKYTLVYVKLKQQIHSTDKNTFTYMNVYLYHKLFLITGHLHLMYLQYFNMKMTLCGWNMLYAMNMGLVILVVSSCFMTSKINNRKTTCTTFYLETGLLSLNY